MLSVVYASQAHAADPTAADCLRASESALSLRGQHKLRDARAQLLVCAAASCPADIQNECGRRVAEVNDAMPTVVFEVKDEKGDDLGAVRVVMDGNVIADRLAGTAISIDPGEHVFVFDASSYAPFEKRLVVREGEKNRRERVTLSRTSGPEAPRAAAQETAPATVKADPARDGSGQRTAGLVAGAAGLVAAGAGAILGLLASSEWSHAQRDCSSGCGLDSPAHAAKKDAEGFATAATIAFTAGAVLVTGGVALTTARPGSLATPSPGTPR